MTTVITIGGVALSSAVASHVLDQLGQKHIALALNVMVSLFLIYTLGDFMMTAARNIIRMFGGLPL